MRCSTTSAGPAISDLLSLSRGPRRYSLHQSDRENSKTRKRMKGLNKWIKRNKNRLWIRSPGSWAKCWHLWELMAIACRTGICQADDLPSTTHPRHQIKSWNKLAMAIGFHWGLKGLASNEVDWFSSPLGVMFCQNSYLFFFRRSINRSSTDSWQTDRKVIVVVVVVSIKMLKDVHICIMANGRWMHSFLNAFF